MNLIYDGENLTTTKFSSSQTYAPDEITVFISKEYLNCKMYLVVRDCKNKMDVIKLKQINSTNIKYFNYTPAFDSPLKINEGECYISLIGINSENGVVQFSTPSITVLLANIDYNFKAQISLIEQFSKASASTYRQMYELYNKVVELTNMNIDILKSTEGGDEAQ